MEKGVGEIGKPSNGRERYRSASRLIFIIQNVNGWITPRQFNSDFEIGGCERSTFRAMECLVRIGMLEQKKFPPPKHGNHIWKFRRTGSKLNPERCKSCGQKFFDLEMHEYQTNCSGAKGGTQ